MNKIKLEELTNDELNITLQRNGLNPCVENDEDRDIAINILKQLFKD